LNSRFIVRAIGIVTILIALAIAAVTAYFKSPAFDARARRYIVQELENRTGARVTLGNLDWSFWQRRIRLEDLTLHGLEPDGHPPLAHFGRIDIGLNIRTLLERKIDLYELAIFQPEFHILVGPDGKTNFPTPQTSSPGQPSGFQISIQNFNVLQGSAIINERRLDIDLSLTNLAALLNYHPTREVLEAHLRFDGVLDRSPDLRLPIPYTLSADLDYTRATIIAQRLNIVSGKSEMKLQGKISQILSSDFSGKLDYIGTLQVRFLNYFFETEKFAGQAAAAGFLEFSNGKFSTQGHAISEAIDYDEWHTTNITTDYAYRYPDRRMTFSKLKSSFVGGSVIGDAAVENLPGTPRVVVNLNYADIDAAGLARAYPWDPRYRIFSKASGTLDGWFEGKLSRYDFSGHVDLKSYPPNPVTNPPNASLVALPLDGSTDYQLSPDEAHVTNANGQFRSTTLKADGVIRDSTSELAIDVTSPDLKDLAFLYPDANGSGTFVGTVMGEIAKPILDGQFTLDNYAYRQWKMEHAAGRARVDLAKEDASLKDVRVKQGESEILVNGTTALAGNPIDLRIQSNRVTSQDLRPFIDRDIDGTLAGDVHVTALSPAMKAEGDVKADNLSIDKHFIGNVTGHVRYFEPVIDLTQLSVRQGNSTLTGNVNFNRTTEAIKFNARVNTVNLDTFRPLGLPDVIKGVIRQATVQGDGTLKQPTLQGNGILQDLSVNGEIFPEARVNVATTGNKLDVELDTGPRLNLKGQIDTAAAGYPFTARAVFNQYSVEHIAQFSQGSIVATGNANLSGLLTDSSRLRGDGRIESADIRVQDTNLKPTQPFTFSFDPTELTVSNVTLTGQSTQVTLAGTIGLRDPAPLNLQVMGQVDLKLVSARFPDLVSSGVINLQVNVRGTTQTPDLRGTGTLINASLRRMGLFTGLTNLNGNLTFNQTQIRVDRLDGIAGGGTVHAEGTADLQGGTIQGLNVQIEAKNVRYRGYPEGFRTVIDSTLSLRGTLASPLLEGNVQIQSLAYKSSFEDFLAMLNEETLKTASPVGALRLSLHIEGGKNITIQNQLAEVEARVEIDLKGTVAEPSVTGHIEASGGTLSFQGNRYTVTRGNIDFVDPLKIQPVIDIEAESQVRDYRVILSITGRGDNPKLSMRSDPPLPELEIVSLIAGGRTREEIAAKSGSAVPTSEQLFQSGAASLLFDLLQQRVGNRLGLLGTGRVRIDPFLLGTENNPGARITLSQQVTKDLTVTYSQDLSSNRQQVILIEYFFSRNTSILASKDELGNFGLDLRHRTRIK